MLQGELSNLIQCGTAGIHRGNNSQKEQPVNTATWSLYLTVGVPVHRDGPRAALFLGLLHTAISGQHINAILASEQSYLIKCL